VAFDSSTDKPKFFSQWEPAEVSANNPFVNRGPGASAYSVAKAGLAQLARVAALEFGKKGIRVI